MDIMMKTGCNMKKASNGTAEDFVEYTIHPTETCLFKGDKDKYLPILRDECLSILSQYTMHYMWHQDPFTLKVKETHLYGKARIGDNIEDEWFIISLLYKLTELMPELVVRVVDQDGEVLLIESADHLPKWAQEPDMSDSRVYIYRNEMHLIPVAHDPSQLTPIPAGKPNVEDAVQTVQRFPEVTRASPQIQSVIKSRMNSYPDDWSDQKQYVHMMVPKKIKCLLSLAPKYLISAAIRCFYFRDMIDIRNCRTIKHFSPNEGLVKVGVTLSKCLYAMLVKQEFKPDKKSGWAMPRASEGKDYKAADLGMKLTCGFEMLLTQSKIKIPEGVEDTTSPSFDEVRYKRFEETLYSNGYFKHELKGSKNWTTLASQAKEYFMAFFPPLDTQMDSDDFDSLSGQLYRILGRLENKRLPDSNNDDALIENEELSKEPDDDSWLNIDPQSFDEMLKKHFSLQDKESATATTLRNTTEEEIPAELKKFLTTMSDFEGVELSNDKMECENLENNEIKFNIHDFENAMKKMVNIKDNENCDEIESSSDDENMEEEYDLNNDIEIREPELKSYLDQMKGELQGTKVIPSTNDCDDVIESLDDLNKPINVDAKVLKNILESYNSQNGLPGPVSTLLQPLGIDICDKS